MKCDAHCSFAQGFDRIMIEDMRGHDDWTMVPVMRNLHVFNWVCPDGHTRYQGPSGLCKECGKPTRQDVVWIAKNNPQSVSYCFDSEPHFQYFNEYKKRPEYKGDLTETMSLQGSCWMLTREKYWELDVCEENFGSWGSQGIEVACKTWLSGGRVIVNHRTYYAHCFRTQGGDFGFPYPISGHQVENAKKHARELFFDNKWPKAIHPLSWLVKKFWPVKGWTDADLVQLIERESKSLNIVAQLEAPSPYYAEPAESQPIAPTKGIVYYTDNCLDPLIMRACQNQLNIARKDYELITISLQPIDFGSNIVLQLERSILTMFRQQLAGIEASSADIIFLCEHDVLYHPSHFDFTPPSKDLFYYNGNAWWVRATDGHAVRVSQARAVSGLCASRDLLLEHYRKRVALVEKNGWSLRIGFEPGTHHRPERVDDYWHDQYDSVYPNLDVRHDKNASPTRWSKDQFRNQRYTEGWTEAEEVAPWYTKGKFNDMLRDLAKGR